ncbi:MAG: hypothetical protein IKH57_21015 [Clostridia bacterium]|nr:hypothetical protein [Clostridia bacterium]
MPRTNQSSFLQNLFYPFNTHEGSGQNGTQEVIENALPDCTVLQGLAIQDKTAQENGEKCDIIDAGSE